MFSESCSVIILGLFKGNFIVKLGGISSGFHNVNERTSIDEEDRDKAMESARRNKPHLYHVHGTSTKNTRAMEVRRMLVVSKLSQVECKAENLNSSDTFVLVYYTKVSEESYNYFQIIWMGSGCEDVERELAEKIAENMRKVKQNASVTIVNEGQEPPEFWNFLGGMFVPLLP